MTDKNSQVSLDDFYTPEFILQKERFYGMNYLSSGGEIAIKDLLLRADLKPNEKVLDICCGQGGPTMYMARHYGVHVHGVELSQNLINLGRQRLAACEPIVQQRIHLEHADASTVHLKKNYYDVVYSKDSINMISDKEKVFRNIMNCIREDGRLFISDWCNGDFIFNQLCSNSGYKLNWSSKLATVSTNIHNMEVAGFTNVKAEDLTKDMINYLDISLRQFKATKQAFIQDYDSDSYQTMENDFSNTVAMMKEGAIRWVIFTASASEE